MRLMQHPDTDQCKKRASVSQTEMNGWAWVVPLILISRYSRQPDIFKGVAGTFIDPAVTSFYNSVAEDDATQLKRKKKKTAPDCERPKCEQSQQFCTPSSPSLSLSLRSDQLPRWPGRGGGELVWFLLWWNKSHRVERQRGNPKRVLQEQGHACEVRPVLGLCRGLHHRWSSSFALLFCQIDFFYPDLGAMQKKGNLFK